MASVTKQIAHGAGWMLLFKVGERSLAVVSTAILARLLTPADFGVVAMAMSIIAGVELFASFGFDVALIQDRNATRATYDSAWTMNVIACVCCALALLLLALPTAHFYREPRLELIVPLLALGTLIMGFENNGTVAFRKEMDFRREFRFLILKKVAGFAVTVPLAFVLRSFWALIAGMLFSRVAGVALSYLLHPFRPRFSLSECAKLFHFSKWLLINNVLFFLNARLPDFVVGRVSGPRSLGLYSIGAELANMPTNEIVAPINRAIYPGYAQHSGNLPQLTAVYIRIASVLWLLAPPAGAGMCLVADSLVRLLLGEQWLEAVPLVQVLAIAGALGVITANQVYVYLAAGRPFIITVIAMGQLAVMFGSAMYLVPKFGTMGMAYAVLVVATLSVPVNSIILLRITHLPLRELLAAAWRPAMATLAMACAVLIVAWPRYGAHPSTQEVFLTLLTQVGVGIATFAISALLLWRLAGAPDGAERVALDFVRARVAAGWSRFTATRRP